MPNELRDILDNIRGNGVQQGLGEVELPTFDSYNSNAGKVEDIKKNVPIEAIYDRLHDGTYVAKYENYVGATGNEDRLAKQQGFFEQIGRGIGKAIVKTGAYALDATVGTAYGVFNGISKGSWDAVWDNDFSNSLDDFNKRLDNNFSNYYTDEERDNGLLAAIPGFGATNFWFNDVAGGLAFVVGAILPESVIGALTGGASLGVGGAKAGLKFGAKKFAKEGVEQTAKGRIKKFISKVPGVKQYRNGSDVIRKYSRVALGKTVGDIASTSAFLVRTSNFEAGMEARHNFHDAIDSYMREFEGNNGRQPTYEEISEFTKEAKSAANGVYAANMAILSVSNAVMFSNKFNIGVQLRKNVVNNWNKVLGLGYENKAGKLILDKATKTQRLVGNAYFVLGKPAVEGLYEEGLQGVAGTTMQNYLNSKYDPEVESGYGMLASLYDGFAEQYGTKEGWKEMGIGFIIGSMGGVFQKGSPAFAGIKSDSRKSRQERIEGQIKEANTSQDSILRRMNTATAITNHGNLIKSKSENLESTAIENSQLNVLHIQSQESLKSHKEIGADFDAVIDNMKLTEAQMEEFGASELEQEAGLDSYKQSLKEDFKRDTKDYRVAKKFVGALGFDRGTDTKGNDFEVGQALIMNIVAGKGAINNAKNISSQIDTLIGTTGIFNSLEHFNNLSQKEKDKVSEVRKKKRQLNSAKRNAKKYADQLAGVPTGEKRELTDSTKHSRYKKASEKHVVATNEVITLQEELDTLREAIGTDETKFRAENLNIDGLTTVDGFKDITEIVEELDKLTMFQESLEKSGRTKDAEMLGRLIEDFKANSDAHREMNNSFRKMLDTDFFNKKAGKGLRGMIVGDRYKMSDDFKKIIKDNDALIDASLKQVKYRGTDTVEEILRVGLEEGEELSDREKYRLEAIIRLQLGYQKIGDKIEEIQDETQIVETVEDKNTDTLKGDTITLKSKLNPEGKDLGNINVLNKLIRQITDELDSFKNSRVTKKRQAELTTELEKLKKIKEGRESKVLSKSEESLLEGLRKDIVVEEGENGNETTAKKIAKQILNLESRITSEEDINTTNSRVQEIEDELESLDKSGNVKMLKSRDYQRFYSLSQKNEREGLSEEEQLEHDELSEDIDQWIELTGTVVEGLRLSDLIRQKVVLEETEIAVVEDVSEITSSEVLSSVDIGDKTSSANYGEAQSYHAVTAIVNKKGFVEISGVSYEKLSQVVGIPFEVEKSDDQNNILITKETAEIINGLGSVFILPTNTNLTTNYSIVLNEMTLADGSKEITAMLTDFNDFNSTMNVEDIYNMVEGDEIQLKVDPKDSWNEILFKKYKNAKTKKGKQTALNNLKKSMVIQVWNSNGQFVAVLKQKRKGGNKTPNGELFEAMRDQIVETEHFVDALAGTMSKEEIELGGRVVVERVHLGQPNFNFVKNEEGGISVEHRTLTKQDIEKVADIGYIEDGKPVTQSNKGDIRLTFLDKAMKKNKNARIPFIVIEKGNQRIAYPVKLQTIQKAGIEEFKKVYRSNSDNITKAVTLNAMMAGRGVDIKIPGNSFIAVGKTNLNDEFFSNKLAQLESIKYFSDIKVWGDKKVDKALTLKNGVSVDINLSEPLHSPKLRLDYSNLDIKVSNKDVPQGSTKEVVTKGVDQLDSIIKDCKG